MQLMDKAQFLTMPPETIFSRFYPELMTQPYDPGDIQPVAFGNLCIKGETRAGEFTFRELSGAANDDGYADQNREALVSGIAMINRYRQQFDLNADYKTYDLVLDDAQAETFEELYAVWDEDDVRNLSLRLSRLDRTPNPRPLPALLSTVDELVAKWVSVEDSAATS